MDKDEIKKQVELLKGKDSKQGYEALKLLVAASNGSGDVHSYMEEFFSMIDDSNSYIRTRALILIVENAKWDEEGRIEEEIERLLIHITDEKPITARQFIKLLPKLAGDKPELRGYITEALKNADLSGYKEDTMRPLIEKDINEAEKKMQKNRGGKK